MKIPKEIENALKRRVRAAIALLETDAIITDFIEKNEIKAEEYDYNTGIEMYANPLDSADRIRKAIRAKDN